MNFNKYFIFIVFFVLILSVSAVSAADNFDTNDNSSYNLINAREDVSSDSTTINKNWTVYEFLNNYNDIQDNDVVLIRNGSGTPTESIVLNQNAITIFTEGNVIFDGQGKNLHFEIKGSNVIIQGITFKNFNFTGNGGAIRWNGDHGTLNNCNFINNTAERYAGAVYWNGTDGNITNCNFINNAATYGGAVYWKGANGNITNCNFINNAATYAGSVNWNGANGTLTSCTFTNNTAECNGGAITWDGDNGTLSDSNFTANSANTYSGGAVYWDGDYGVLSGSTFTNNTAVSYGGAVLWNGGKGIITNSTFKGNTAERYGGGVFWIGDEGTITHSAFKGNTAERYAGAVYWDGDYGVLSGSTFTGNIAVYSGAVYWDGDRGFLARCIFINNTAVSEGGGILWNGADGALFDSDFTANVATNNYGGGIHWVGANGIIFNSAFTNNAAKGDGGGILWRGIKGTLKNCKFSNNKGRYGGAVYWMGDGGNIINSAFKGNSAERYGGGIFWRGVKCTLKNCKFFNNTGQCGGGVYWTSTDGILSGNILADNSADYGAGVCFDCANGSLNNNTFTNNIAKTNGGALYLSGTCIDSNVTNSTFTNNVASAYGGAVYWAADNGKLTGCYFTGNSAHISGGAVYWDSSDGVLTDSTFTDNLASNLGGAVYWNRSKGIIKNSTFKDNTANYGGAVCWSAAGSMVNCTFANVKWVKSNGIYAQNDLSIEGGNGIVDVFATNTISGITITVLDNETYYLSPNQNIKVTGKIMSGNLTIVDSSNDAFKFDFDGVAAGDKPEISDNGEYYINYTSATPAAIAVRGNYDKADSSVKYRNGNLIFKDDLDDPDLNVTFDQDTVTVTLNNQTTGHVIVYVNGIRHILNIVDGKASLHVSDPSGHYNVTVVYPGDANFKSAELSKEFDTDSAHVLEAEDIVKYFRNGTQYHVSLKDGYSNPISGKRITVTLVNSRHTNPVQYVIITDSRGIATLVINANPGIYYATAVYGNQSVTNTITVLASGYSIDAQDIFMTFKDGTSYTARLTYSEGTPVSNVYMSIFLKTKSSGKVYKILTDGNGVATLPINLNPGQYTMAAEYMGEAVTTRMVVLSGSHIIMAGDIVKYFKNGTQYTVKVTDLDGNPVSGQKVEVKLNSATWSKQAYYNITTDGNGIATLAINLSPGQYTAEVKIGSDTVQSKIIVLPTLTSENLIKPVNQPGDLVAKLVDGQGNPASGKTLTFTVKTKTYTKTTDSNGLASLPINLGVGTWTIDIANPETGAKATAKVFIAKAKT